MDSITVSTKQELASAKESGYDEILVVGKLSSDLKKTKNIAYAGATTIAVLTAALIATPFTGGLTMFAAAPVAALTGIEISAIIISASLGVSLIIAVFRDYEEISYGPNGMLLQKKK